MPLTRFNQRTFHRTLFAGWLETVTLLKRGDDQKTNIVTRFVFYETWWGRIFKTGEPIQEDMVVGHRRLLHIPVIELEKHGITHLSNLDRFIDEKCRYWEPEATTEIVIKLGEQHFDVNCLRVDPPR